MVIYTLKCPRNLLQVQQKPDTIALRVKSIHYLFSLFIPALPETASFFHSHLFSHNWLGGIAVQISELSIFHSAGGKSIAASDLCFFLSVTEWKKRRWNHEAVEECVWPVFCGWTHLTLEQGWWSIPVTFSINIPCENLFCKFVVDKDQTAH